MSGATPDTGASGAAAPHRFAGLARAPVSWSGARGDSAPVDDGAWPRRLLFVRAIARRNFAEAPFWVACSAEDGEALAHTAIAQARAEGLTSGYRLAALSPGDIGLLRERMLLPGQPVSFPATRHAKRIFLAREGSADSGTHALFGEVEHWTRIHTRGPAHAPATPSSPSPPASLSPEILRDIAQRTGRAADASSASPSSAFATGSACSFAYAEPWGFLASNPAHAGTGLQFEAGVHVPALSDPTSRALMMQAVRALAATGHELQPLSLRAPGAASSGFFRLVSRGSAGLTEEEHAIRFAHHLDLVLRIEEEAWAALQSRDPFAMEDRMHRALRILQEARRLEEAEAQSLISFARAGVYAGAFPACLLPSLETLRVQAQPFHVRAGMGADEAASEPVARANLARRLLSFA